MSRRIAPRSGTAFTLRAGEILRVTDPKGGQVSDMLAFMAGSFLGYWGEWPVRIIGGALLLSAANTAINGIMSILYVMSRDAKSAMSCSCVTRTTVMPLRFSSCNSAITSKLVRVSSAPVGSSASMSTGLFTRARAIATRCC